MASSQCIKETSLNSDTNGSDHSEVNPTNNVSDNPKSVKKRKISLSEDTPSSTHANEATPNKKNRANTSEDIEEQDMNCSGQSNGDSVRIKVEADEDHGTEPDTNEEEDRPGQSNGEIDLPAANEQTIKVEADAEDTTTEQPSCSSTRSRDNDTPSVKVEEAEATSTSRESCKYGIRCYRRNPRHRIEEAHPGDADYRRPDYPLPPLGTPNCPYGNLCYRRNPIHFRNYTHPPDTDFKQNYKNYKMRLRRRNNNKSREESDASDIDDYDLEDPFINDSEIDSDYQPSGSEEEEDYDDCDKDEE